MEIFNGIHYTVEINYRVQPHFAKILVPQKKKYIVIIPKIVLICMPSRAKVRLYIFSDFYIMKMNIPYRLDIYELLNRTSC